MTLVAAMKIGVVIQALLGGASGTPESEDDARTVRAELGGGGVHHTQCGPSNSPCTLRFRPRGTGGGDGVALVIRMECNPELDEQCLADTRSVVELATSGQIHEWPETGCFAEGRTARWQYRVAPVGIVLFTDKRAAGREILTAPDVPACGTPRKLKLTPLSPNRCLTAHELLSEQSPLAEVLRGLTRCLPAPDAGRDESSDLVTLGPLFCAPTPPQAPRARIVVSSKAEKGARFLLHAQVGTWPTKALLDIIPCGEFTVRVVERGGGLFVADTN